MIFASSTSSATSIAVSGPSGMLQSRAISDISRVDARTGVKLHPSRIPAPVRCLITSMRSISFSSVSYQGRFKKNLVARVSGLTLTEANFCLPHDRDKILVEKFVNHIIGFHSLRQTQIKSCQDYRHNHQVSH